MAFLRAESFDAATPLGIAESKGHFAIYLEPLGYTVETSSFVGAAPALHEALISGDLDLVDYAGFAGILGKSRGIDTTAIAVTQWGSGWSLAAAPDIASIAQRKEGCLSARSDTTDVPHQGPRRRRPHV